jgi:toxin FitB
MHLYILDTNVISELRPGKLKAAKAVLSWANTIVNNQIYLTAISILELEIGVQLLERKTPSQGLALRKWLEGVKDTYADRTLPFTGQTAVFCAPLHVPNPSSDRDAMIAGSALEHSFTLVTRNVSDFDRIKIKIINPWDFTDQ